MTASVAARSGSTPGSGKDAEGQGKELSIEPLIEALSDEADGVRGGAAASLRTSGSPKAVGPLINGLKDEEDWIRETCARSLGALRAQEAIPPLYEIAINTSESESLRYAAAGALEQIAGQRPRIRKKGPPSLRFVCLAIVISFVPVAIGVFVCDPGLWRQVCMWPGCPLFLGVVIWALSQLPETLAPSKERKAFLQAAANLPDATTLNTSSQETEPPPSATTGDAPSQETENRPSHDKAHEATPGYFVKTKADGKIQGPFSDKQLKGLAGQGKLKPGHLISKNKKAWHQASTVKGLSFPSEKAAADARSLDRPAPGPFKGKEAAHYLQEVAFEIKTTAVAPPKGQMDAERQAFLPRLDEGRARAVKFRRDWMANAESQFAAQGFAGMAAAAFTDPIDEVIPGWWSLAVIFDYNNMDSSYGIQAFQAFFGRVGPADLHGPMTLHFGDLIQFDTFCALMLRTKSLADVAHVANQLGPGFDYVGLQPHPVRFLRADKSDGHLIARTFSLPISAELRGGCAYPDSQAGVDWIVDEAVKGTAWKKK